MSPEDAQFTDACLVLVGHGSTLNADSSAPVYQHADELRRRGVFAQVLECFWKEEPSIGAVLRAASAPRVFVVPFFISEGYFTQEVVPRELGLRLPGQTDFPRVVARGGQTIHYCDPIGTHPSMTDLLLSRADEVVRKAPFPRRPAARDISLFIAGHGTGENRNSRKSVEHQVEQIRRRDLYAGVHAVFIEEEPRIGACYEMATTEGIVVVPFFLSDGLHVREDIPVLLREPELKVRERLNRGQATWRNPTEKKGKLVWVAPAIGSEPGLADVILDRVREASCGD